MRKGDRTASGSLRGDTPPHTHTPPGVPRGAPAAPAGQHRGLGHREGCSVTLSAPSPTSPLGPGPPTPPPERSPRQLGVLIREGGGGAGVREGKSPETRSAGSGARANSGEDASALSLLCISSTRKANSSAEGLNQAFI